MVVSIEVNHTVLINMTEYNPNEGASAGQNTVGGFDLALCRHDVEKAIHEKSTRST